MSGHYIVAGEFLALETVVRRPCLLEAPARLPIGRRSSRIRSSAITTSVRRCGSFGLPAWLKAVWP